MEWPFWYIWRTHKPWYFWGHIKWLIRIVLSTNKQTNLFKNFLNYFLKFISIRKHLSITGPVLSNTNQNGETDEHFLLSGYFMVNLWYRSHGSAKRANLLRLKNSPGIVRIEEHRAFGGVPRRSPFHGVGRAHFCEEERRGKTYLRSISQGTLNDLPRNKLQSM